ncbi:MAG: hypothetical protein WD768_22570 [Phycisphaeraceae bacterium]
MIPPFNDNGYLPPGLHPATLDEIEARFGLETEIRRVQMESLRWLVDLAWKAGVERVVVNGSFVTDKAEPNDVDCALLAGRDYPVDQKASEALEAGLPFINGGVVTADDFREYVEDTFVTDRKLVQKGMVEILR